MLDRNYLNNSIELSENKNKILPSKLVGENKHFPPANKEWNNSIYAYNKNSVKSLPAKDEMVNKLIKSYFYLSNNKTIARSRRMRSLIRKKTPNKIFISKSEIKQTNDKVMVTVYTFNKEKQILIRKIFFYDRKRNLLDSWRKRNLIEIKPTPLKKKLVTIRKNKNKTYITKYINLKSKILKQYNLKHNFIKLIGLSAKKRKMLVKFRKNISALNTKKKRLENLTKLNYFYINKLKLKSSIRKRKNMFKKRVKRSIPFSGVKMKNEMNFLTFKVLTKKKQFMILRKLFYYYFLKYVLSMFKVKVFAYKSEINSVLSVLENKKTNEKVYLNKKARRKHKLYELALILQPMADKFNQGNNKICFITGKSKFLINLNLNDKLKYLQTNKLDRINYIMLKKNLMVSQFLTNVLIKSKVKHIENKLYFLFNGYCKKYYLNFLSKISKKEAFLANNYVKLLLNKSKFNKFLPGLKHLIGKVYNKKTELNIIDLKYPQLNTDIFTESIALQLKGKAGLLKVLKRCLLLVKTPYQFFNKTEKIKRFDLNQIYNLNSYRSIKLNNLQQTKEFDLNNITCFSPDYLQNVLEKIYPRTLSLAEESVNINNSLVNKETKVVVKTKKEITQENETKVIKTKLINVLNSIKYKWVTGARIEASGRLTRRYSASRSVFKFKYKGSLKNIDFSRKLDFLRKSMPTVKLRNQVKANSQYTFTKSKKRIGAFGVKGWISGF